MEANTEDFERFLCHLYFAKHYSCLPYTVDDLVLDMRPPPTVTLDSPASANSLGIEYKSSTNFFTGHPPVVSEPTMSLCHYFDCAAILSHAEDNCMLFMKAMEDELDDDDESKWQELWPLFLLALQFDLQRVKKACISQLTNYCLRGSSQQGVGECAIAAGQGHTVRHHADDIRRR